MLELEPLGFYPRALIGLSDEEPILLTSRPGREYDVDV